MNCVTEWKGSMVTVPLRIVLLGIKQLFISTYFMLAKYNFMSKIADKLHKYLYLLTVFPYLLTSNSRVSGLKHNTSVTFFSKQYRKLIKLLNKTYFCVR